MLSGGIAYSKPVRLIPCYLSNLLKLHSQTFQGVFDALMVTLQKIDGIMLHRTFVVGERITLGDIFMVTALVNAFSGLVDASYRAKLPNLVRYVDR